MTQDQVQEDLKGSLRLSSQPLSSFRNTIKNVQSQSNFNEFDDPGYKRSGSKVFEYKPLVAEKPDEKSTREKLSFKGKMFNFPNVFLHHISKHNCLRMIDFEILAYDKKTIEQLNIISFMS